MGYRSCSRCSLCSQDCETQDHLFLQCHYSQAIWGFIGSKFKVNLPLLNCINGFFEYCLQLSLSQQVKNLLQAAVVAALSAIWTARNKRRYEDMATPLAVSWKFIAGAIQEANLLQQGAMKNTVDDLLILRGLGVKSRPREAPKIISVKWKTPPPGWLKINTDGAALGSPGQAGCGGAFRTCRGFVKGCFWKLLGTLTAFEAEIMAVISAIEYAKTFGWTNLWIESDSMLVVRFLQERLDRVPWKYLASWRRCLRYMDTINYRATHIFQEGNAVADALSKKALEDDIGCWSFTLPGYCTSFHANDLRGDGTFRFK